MLHMLQKCMIINTQAAKAKALRQSPAISCKYKPLAQQLHTHFAYLALQVFQNACATKGSGSCRQKRQYELHSRGRIVSVKLAAPKTKTAISMKFVHLKQY